MTDGGVKRKRRKSQRVSNERIAKALIGRKIIQNGRKWEIYNAVCEWPLIKLYNINATRVVKITRTDGLDLLIHNKPIWSCGDRFELEPKQLKDKDYAKK